MFSTITAATALPIGTRVEAIYYDGTPVAGTVTSRDWWFEVTEDANGRPYWEVPTFNIYPPRDEIRAA